jgi:hypothetical protein
MITIYPNREKKTEVQSKWGRGLPLTLADLVQAVKRNFEMFPGDFMFQLTDDEF